MSNRHTDALHYTLLPPVPGVDLGTLRAVAWELCWTASTENACWPSYRDLADRLGGIDRKAVIRAMRWLWALDLVTTAEGQCNSSRPGWQGSNRYSLRGVVDIPEAQAEYRQGVKAFEGWTQRVPGRTLLFAHPAWAAGEVGAIDHHVGVMDHPGSGLGPLGWWFRTTGVGVINPWGSGPKPPKPLIEHLQSTLKRTLKGSAPPCPRKTEEAGMTGEGSDGGTADA